MVSEKNTPSFTWRVVGYPIMIAIVGGGLGNIFINYPWLYTLLKISGITYLLFLAWLMATTTSQTQTKHRPPLTFIQSSLFQWVNPKAWIMVVTTVSTYLSTEKDLLPQLSAFVIISLLVGIGSSNTWLWLGFYLQKVLKKTQHVQIFNISMALLLVLSISPVIIELFKDYIL